jgi:hypothetical protein
MDVYLDFDCHLDKWNALLLIVLYKKKTGDTKGVNRSRNLKDKQKNGKNEKD